MGNNSGRSSSLSSSSECESPAAAAPRLAGSRSQGTTAAGTAAGDEDIRSTYRIHQVLGAGSFGEVRQVTLIKDASVIRAVKIIEIDDDEDDSKRTMFYREVKLLESVQHVNIVKFWEAYEDKHFLYVVMDICRGGEVFSRIVELRLFTEVDAAFIGAQMVAALAYIHAKSIIHRDTKAENFLLSDKSQTAVVKLIDFGMASKFEHGQFFDELCGSPHYLAPELVGQKYNHMVDIWAFGVLLYLMLYGKYPFDGQEFRDIMLKILAGKIRFRRKDGAPPLSNSAVHILQCCLEVKPSKRLTAQEALKHPWIAKTSKQDNSLDQRSNLIPCVQDAEERVQASRSKLSMEVVQRRENTLQKLEADFHNGVHSGRRLTDPKEEDFMSKPESVRRKNRLMTAPSKQLQYLRTKVTATMEATVGRTTRVEEATKPMQDRAPTSGGASSSSSTHNDTATPAPAQNLRPVPKRKSKPAMSAQGCVYNVQQVSDEELSSLRRLWEETRKKPNGEKVTTTEFFGLFPSAQQGGRDFFDLDALESEGEEEDLDQDSSRHLR
eukprot:TRINITY_DN1625_c0_g1_i1.p1 TRINITY_DN1625_c0_g1~~TRINITY_DN1625_c0_g1_i1.p1  ORF type:complete len:551 (-),score=97.37 TRINITY_DN1625_c0_g1_i1:173-1825(-)